MSDFSLNKTFQGLRSADSSLRILSLMQLQSSDAENLENCAGIEDLCHELGLLRASEDRDVRFLSAKVLNRLQKFMPVSEGPRNPYLGLSDLQMFEKLQTEADPGIISRVLTELARPQDMWQWQLLYSFVSHEDERVRANLVEYLDREWRPEAEEYLSGLLKDESNRVRANAIVALGRRQHAGVRDVLLEMLSQSSVSMRESGLFCLQKLPPEDCYQPFVCASLLESCQPIVARAIDVASAYAGAPVLEAMKTVFFESGSRSLRQKVFRFWQDQGLPEAQRDDVIEALRTQKALQVGSELFAELQSVELFDPRLKAHYFLIVRTKDELRVLLDLKSDTRSASWQSQIRTLQKGLRKGYLALGRVAFDLHRNRDYFFEQCEKAEIQISAFLKHLPKA